MDHLSIQNIGVSGFEQGTYGARIYNDHDLLFEYLSMPVMARIAIEFGVFSGGTVSNYEFSHVDISNCSWGIGGGPGTSTIIANLSIHDSNFHDFGPQLYNGVHGDPVYLFAAAPSGFSSPQIYNNQVYGAMIESSSNSWYFSVGPLTGTTNIYNNSMTYNNVGGSAVSSFFSVSGLAGSPGNVNIFNNSANRPDGTYVGNFIQASNLNTLTIENNIVTGGASNILILGPITNFTSDYNNWYLTPSNGYVAFYSNFASWQASGPLATVAPHAGSLGSGYVNGDTVSVSYGYGATATLTVSGGVVTGATLVTPGFGYPGGNLPTTGGSGTGLRLDTTATAAGYDAHSYNANPDFTSASNLALTAGAPGINSGTNAPSSIFNTDILGNGRPASTNFCMGAYEYGSTLNTPPTFFGFSTTFPAATSGYGTTGTICARWNDAVSITGGPLQVVLNNGKTLNLPNVTSSLTACTPHTIGFGETVSGLQVSSVNQNGATVSDSQGNQSNYTSLGNNLPAGINISTSKTVDTSLACAAGANKCNATIGTCSGCAMSIGGP